MLLLKIPLTPDSSAGKACALISIHQCGALAQLGTVESVYAHPVPGKTINIGSEMLRIVELHEMIERNWKLSHRLNAVFDVAQVN